MPLSFEAGFELGVISVGVLNCQDEPSSDYVCVFWYISEVYPPSAPLGFVDLNLFTFALVNSESLLRGSAIIRTSVSRVSFRRLAVCSELLEATPESPPFFLFITTLSCVTMPDSNYYSTTCEGILCLTLNCTLLLSFMAMTCLPPLRTCDADDTAYRFTNINTQNHRK